MVAKYRFVIEEAIDAELLDGFGIVARSGSETVLLGVVSVMPVLERILEHDLTLVRLEAESE